MANDVAISKKPTKTVKSVTTPKRASGGSHTMSVDVNLGDALVSTKSASRCNKIAMGWTLGTSKKIKKPSTQGDASISSSNKKFTKTKNLNSFNDYTRSSFWPYTDVKLQSVSFWCQPYNSYGKGKKVTKTRGFKVPKKPTISAFAISQYGVVSCTVTSDAGEDYHERARTRYKVHIKNTRTNYDKTITDDSFTALTKSITYNVSDYQQLAYGDYVAITVTAWNQGYAGDSDSVSKTYYVGYPALATIKDVDVSSKSQTGKVTVRIKTNSSTAHPVDEVELEYLSNVAYSTAGSIPGDTSWTVSNIVDDAKCTALAIAVGTIGIPDPGKYNWVRVKSWHAIENVLYRYSTPMRVKGLETPAPTASDDQIKIISTSLGIDGESVKVLMGWDVSGTDDATGTELSWADAEDAWKSTDPPDTFEFTWNDGSYTDTSVTPNVTYPKSATVTIKRLEPGQNVFIRARRYLDLNDVRTYGGYCNAKTQLPSSEVAGEPESVSLSLPGFVARGDNALASWTVGSTAEQTYWALMTSSGKVIADSDGNANSYAIPSERLEALATNNALSVYLAVSTGGDLIISDTKTLTIVDAPTLALASLSTLTAQPFAFTISSNTAARIVASITAQGAAGQNAAGIYEQFNGDTIWSANLQPLWSESSGTYSVTVTITEPQDFIDGAEYTLNLQAIDDETGLKSPEISSTFGVAWAHQAVAAVDCTVTPSDYVDNNGVHHMQATICIVAPTGANQYDVYDIYRYTADGAVLIGSGYPAGESVVDDYAPFGKGMDLYYRIATRTVDGDEEYADIPYTLSGKMLRFDWPYGTLELPYNIDISDSYAKQVQSRMHMDGTNNAYWNAGIRRTARYGSQIVRLDSQSDVAAARQLARYPGGVFVRTPDGSAFEADVQINDMSTTGVIQVFSINIEEIEPTAAFMLPPYETE